MLSHAKARCILREATDRFVGDGDPDDSGERTMTAVSPSIGVVVAPARGVELFGSAGSFFETPTTTELVNRPSGVIPESDDFVQRAAKAALDGFTPEGISFGFSPEEWTKWYSGEYD